MNNARPECRGWNSVSENISLPDLPEQFRPLIAGLQLKALKPRNAIARFPERWGNYSEPGSRGDREIRRSGTHWLRVLFPKRVPDVLAGLPDITVPR